MAAILDFQSEWFLLFLIYKSSWCFLPNFKSNGLSVQQKKWKTDFQDGHHSGYLGFPIRTILAIFDLQVAQMLHTKFQVSWPFGSREEVKNRFSRWWPSWISGRNDRSDFSYFFTPMLSTKFPVNWPMCVGGVGFKSNCWCCTTDTDWPQ